MRLEEAGLFSAFEKIIGRDTIDDFKVCQSLQAKIKNLKQSAAKLRKQEQTEYVTGKIKSIEKEISESYKELRKLSLRNTTKENKK